MNKIQMIIQRNLQYPKKNMLYNKIYKYENVIHVFMTLVWNDLFIFKLLDDSYRCFILLVIFGLVCFVLLVCFAIFSFLLCVFFFCLSPNFLLCVSLNAGSC